MRKLFLACWLCAALAFAATPVLLLPGCSSTQQKIVVNTLVSTHLAVDNTYKAYLDGVLSKAISTNGVPAVSAKYREFQSLYSLALIAAERNPNAPAPQSVLDGAADFITTVDLVK